MSAERVKLIQEASDAMTAAGRIPELAVLMALPDELLQQVIDYHSAH